jgi:tetratricopeptide (TPR) repeat protein
MHLLLRRALQAWLLLCPAVAIAQTRADGTLCNRIENPRFPEARATVQQLGAGSDARSVFFQGCLALADDRPSEAGKLFERVVKVEDVNPVVHFYLGRAYGDQAQKANVFKQAALAHKTKNEFDRAVQLDPDYLDARIGVMEYFSHAPGFMGGSKEKARQQAEEIRRRDPWRGGFAAADLAGRDKDFNRAATEYHQLAAAYPDSAAPALSLTALYLQQKRYDDAFAAVDALVRREPNAMVPQYLLGRIAAESGQQLERGELSLKRYLGYAPKAGEPALASAHLRLGTIYERRNNADAARTEYRSAVALDPKLTAAKDALAKVK